MRMLEAALAAVLVLSPAASFARDNKKKAPEKTPLDLYLESAGEAAAALPRTPGSLYTPGTPLSRLGTDLRAAQVGDIVTVTVYESLSAVSDGVTKTSRASTLSAKAGGVAGHTPRALAPLIDASTGTTLDSQGQTTRHNELTTTLTARVTRVLANGNLVVEGARMVGVNSEQQVIMLRGIVRPVDLSADNAVESGRLALLEVRVNGKGVVNDFIRRPNFLYRLLMGLLPF